ncbi:MAG TPA: TonB-dependent receptor [Terriglobales bacterium]|nr:TonB-dependent receptor [Terriglobales bacterium]
MYIRSCRVLLLLGLMAALCLTTNAQSDRGSITGTVQDSTGAMVANAKISAVDQATGETRTTTSSASGSYQLPELKASTWTLSAEAPGFKKTTYDNVKIAVGVVQSVNITLTVGAASETVNVEGEVQAIQTENATMQTNVTERQVREMPLQVQSDYAGRSPLAFIFLDSNVTSSDNGSQQNATSFRVNGGQALGAEILIDGANTRRAQNGSFFTEVAPGPNAFQEFTYNTSSYSAEFGNSSAGVVNLTLKSGTNKIHGEVYELFRNEALNANSWNNNNQGLRKGRDRQNDFGFNLGGPVYIPKIYDGRNKTFFFFNYNGYRNTKSENRYITIPTAKMRTGDFSELLTDPDVLRINGGNPVLIYNPHQDPNLRTPAAAITGNRLDLYNGGALLDPVGLNILKSYPTPTGSGVFHNYLANSSAPINMDSEVVKIDQILTDKQRLSVSYSYRNQPSIKGGFPRMPSPAIATGVWDQAFKSHYARAQHDYTISPTMLNHFNIGWNRVYVENKNSTYGFDPRTLGMPPGATANLTFPMVEFWDPGILAGGDLTDPRAAQGIGSTWWHDQMGDNMVQINDTVSWSTGKHTFKFGGELRIQQLNMFQNFDNGGHFSFSGEQTRGNDFSTLSGWNMASLATGASRQTWVTITSDKPAYRYKTWAGFVNDDFRVTQRLTLNLGLRYELQLPRTEAHDFYRAFDPTAANPDVNRPGALVSATQSGNRGLMETDKTNFAPRFGLAYSLDNKTVLRGGMGIYYSPFLYGAGGGQQGYRAARYLEPNWGGFGGLGWMTPGVYLSGLPNAPITDPNGQYIGSDVEYFQTDAKTGRTVQWNLDVQRELPGNFVATAAYIGNKGTRLRSNLLRVNAAPLNVLKLGNDLLNKNINAVDATDRAYATSVGVTLPANGDAVYAGFNGSVAQALRPFPQYNRINSGMEALGQSWYNAMNLRVERRFAAGFQFMASYTWSKLITTASDDLSGNSLLNNVLQNPFDPRSVRATSATNAPHVFVFNYLFELPFGKGKPLLNNNSILDKIVGGWQFSGIHRYQSGLPLVVSINGGAYRGFLDMVGYYGNLRPNLTGQNPVQSYNATGATVDVLNPAAFSAPPQYTNCPGGCVIGNAAYAAYYNRDPNVWFGTAPAVLGNTVLPYYSENFSLLKKVSVTEGMFAEIGAEFFNPFNRHRYWMPDSNLDGFNNGNPTNGNFGVSSVQDDPRVIQLRVRFVF